MLRIYTDRRCDGRLVSLLEGGYDIASVPRLVAAYLGLDAGPDAGLDAAARPPRGED